MKEIKGKVEYINESKNNKSAVFHSGNRRGFKTKGDKGKSRMYKCESGATDSDSP